MPDKSAATTTMDQGGAGETQGDSDGKEATSEDTAEHKEANVQELNHKERVEKAEIQQAEPDKITESSKGEEEVSGTSVDSKAGR